MSTKVYNAFRLQGNLNAAFTLLNTDENRKIVKKLVDARVGNFIARQVVRMIDRQALGYQSGCQSSFIFEANRTWNDLSKDGSAICDTDVNISLIPYREYTLGMVFSPFDMGFIFSLLGVERFEYWDNSDKADDISDDDWAERGRIWKDACPTTPSQVGLSLQLSQTPELMGAKALFKYVPSRIERATAMAQDELTATAIKRCEALGEKADIWQAMRLDRQLVRRVAESYEGQLPQLSVSDLNR